jgi:hypothetical protein
MHNIIVDAVGKKDLRPSLTKLKRYGRDILELIEEMWDKVDCQFLKFSLGNLTSFCCCKDPELRPTMPEVCARLSALMR